MGELNPLPFYKTSLNAHGTPFMHLDKMKNYSLFLVSKICLRQRDIPYSIRKQLLQLSPPIFTQDFLHAQLLLHFWFTVVVVVSFATLSTSLFF